MKKCDAMGKDVEGKQVGIQTTLGGQCGQMRFELEIERQYRIAPFRLQDGKLWIGKSSFVFRKHVRHIIFLF